MLLGQSAFCALAAIAVGFFVEDKTPYNNDVPAPKENPFKSAVTVMKLPAVWMMVVLIFCGYGMYIGITYMTPYTTNVLGASIAFGAVLGTIRAFGLRVLTGPFSGYISDKMGSAAKILAICFVIIIGMLFVILSLPKGTSNAVIILLTMMFSFFGLVIYTTMFACMEEVSIPPQYTGIAVSVISLLGYLPDGLFPPLFGHWLDVYGNQGYSVIFYFLAASAFSGAASLSSSTARDARSLQARRGLMPRPVLEREENFFSDFPLGWNHGQGIFPVIPLELQGKKHQPFSITQPSGNGCPAPPASEWAYAKRLPLAGSGAL